MHALTTADLFRAAWPRHTAKQAARAADGPVATAKAWVQRRFTPSADTLLRMAAENKELRAELVRLLGEWDANVDQAGAGGVASSPLPVAGQAGRQTGPAGVASGVGRGRRG